MRKARWFFSGGLAALPMLMAALPVKAATTLTQAAGIDHVKAVTASGDLYTALRADGTVVTFSRTVGAGQVTEILGGIAVAAGTKGNLVLLADGTVWRWR